SGRREREHDRARRGQRRADARGPLAPEKKHDREKGEDPARGPECDVSEKHEGKGYLRRGFNPSLASRRSSPLPWSFQYSRRCDPESSPESSASWRGVSFHSQRTTRWG